MSTLSRKNRPSTAPFPLPSSRSPTHTFGSSPSRTSSLLISSPLSLQQSPKPTTPQTNYQKPVLWRGHEPNKPSKLLKVLELKEMGSTEKLHHSLYQNMSISATSLKHQMLIHNAKTTINSRLHPFVLFEQKRLKSKKHLVAVDDLTSGMDVPNTLKHHLKFDVLQGWLLGKSQHLDRMSKQVSTLDNHIPPHCVEYKELKDKNRLMSMNESQKKIWLKDIKEAKIRAKERRDWDKAEVSPARYDAGDSSFIRNYTAPPSSFSREKSRERKVKVESSSVTDGKSRKTIPPLPETNNIIQSDASPLKWNDNNYDSSITSNNQRLQHCRKNEATHRPSTSTLKKSHTTSNARKLEHNGYKKNDHPHSAKPKRNGDTNVGDKFNVLSESYDLYETVDRIMDNAMMSDNRIWDDDDTGKAKRRVKDKLNPDNSGSYTNTFDSVLRRNKNNGDLQRTNSNSRYEDASPIWNDNERGTDSSGSYTNTFDSRADARVIRRDKSSADLRRANSYNRKYEDASSIWNDNERRGGVKTVMGREGSGSDLRWKDDGNDLRWRDSIHVL